MENSKEKKAINAKDATKGLINGFVAYGILIMFIFVTAVVISIWAIDNNKLNIDYNTLKYSLPLLGAFFAFFLIRGICRLSTFDTFKKYKIEKTDIDIVQNRMNLFYICCIIFLVIIIVVYLLARLYNERLEIINYRKTLSYSNYSEDYIDYLTKSQLNSFQERKSDIIISSTIIEAGFILGMFSLFSAQKRLIERYN